MKVTILYTRFDDHLPENKFNEFLNLLPNDQSERNRRFVRWQDRHSHLLGRMLLKTGLEMHGFKESCLGDLNYCKFNRPYLKDNIDFNISHSGCYVICAIGEEVKLGIDVEKIYGVEFKDFKKVMTSEQWEEINHSECPSRAFFQYWTIKESVIKADGRGLSIPLQELHVKENMVVYDNSTWHLHQLSIDSEYCACLATNVENVDISLKYIDFFGENELKRRRETGNGNQEIPVNQLSNDQ